MLALSSTSQLVDALQRGRVIDVEAYTIEGRGVLGALEAAAQRGARVAVRLESQPAGDPRGHLAEYNRRLALQMRAHGIDATLEPRVHAKTIDVDGTRFLDEKNWDGVSDLVLRDDDPRDGAVAMRKNDALAQETALLAKAVNGDGVIVESETFGASGVSAALRRLAREGQRPRLLVSDRSLRGNAKERALLTGLAADGVRVRVCADSAKLAAVGHRAWLGSANATPAWGPYDMTDWGTQTEDAAIAGAVRRRLEQQWADARPL